MRFKHVMSCIKIDTLGLNGVYVSITNCAYVYCSYVRNHAFGPLLLLLKRHLAGVGEDAREWLLEVAIGLFIRHKD
ncbi:hypothetical protein T09_4637 [Trichinella sp. T9]|nr:hypothetical protein T09_4637 [Trichinella sp. T9]